MTRCPVCERRPVTSRDSGLCRACQQAVARLRDYTPAELLSIECSYRTTYRRALVARVGLPALSRDRRDNTA